MKAAAQNTHCASKKRLDKAQRWTLMHHTAPSHMDSTKVESPARWHRVRLMCGASWFDWQQGARGRNPSFSKLWKVCGTITRLAVAGRCGYEHWAHRIVAPFFVRSGTCWNCEAAESAAAN